MDKWMEKWMDGWVVGRVDGQAGRAIVLVGGCVGCWMN